VPARGQRRERSLTPALDAHGFSFQARGGTRSTTAAAAFRDLLGVKPKCS
jgi:hypothetical protein